MFRKNRMAYAMIQKPFIYLCICVLMLLLLVIMLCAPAQAQSITPATEVVNISPIWNQLLVILLGIMSALVSVGGYLINKKLGISATSAQGQHVSAMVADLADFAYGEIQSLAAHNQTIDLPTVVANAYKQASPAGIAAAEALGLTPTHITARINNSLLSLIAAPSSPSITLASKVPLSATMPIPVMPPLPSKELPPKL